MAKKLCAFRLSEFAFNAFDRIAKDQGITRTAAVELAAAISTGALYGQKPEGQPVNTAGATETTLGGLKTPLKEA